MIPAWLTPFVNCSTTIKFVLRLTESLLTITNKSFWLIAMIKVIFVVDYAT